MSDDTSTSSPSETVQEPKIIEEIPVPEPVVAKTEAGPPEQRQVAPATAKVEPSAPNVPSTIVPDQSQAGATPPPKVNSVPESALEASVTAPHPAPGSDLTPKSPMPPALSESVKHESKAAAPITGSSPLPQPAKGSEAIAPEKSVPQQTQPDPVPSATLGAAEIPSPRPASPVTQTPSASAPQVAAPGAAKPQASPLSKPAQPSPPRPQGTSGAQRKTEPQKSVTPHPAAGKPHLARQEPVKAASARPAATVRPPTPHMTAAPSVKQEPTVPAPASGTPSVFVQPVPAPATSAPRTTDAGPAVAAPALSPGTVAATAASGDVPQEGKNDGSSPLPDPSKMFLGKAFPFLIVSGIGLAFLLAVLMVRAILSGSSENSPEAQEVVSFSGWGVNSAGDRQLPNQKTNLGEGRSVFFAIDPATGRLWPVLCNNGEPLAYLLTSGEMIRPGEWFAYHWDADSGMLWYGTRRFIRSLGIQAEGGIEPVGGGSTFWGDGLELIEQPGVPAAFRQQMRRAVGLE